MAEPEPPIDELPRAVPDAPRRMRIPYVWILPILVVAAGLFVAVREKLEQGTAINITFRTADDLEPNRTKIRYKAVEIGEVTDIHVSKDRKFVVVEARIRRSARDYLVADTRFWVVRPRVSAGNISGLTTLVSGAYIDVDIGHSTEPQRHFEGLEVPPIVTSGLPGREFVLHADDLGSLTIGSQVFYRHVPAGQVVAYALEHGGTGVSLKVFINSPYDEFVTSKTRFWEASGIDMSVDSNGVRFHTESLASILEGGIAFRSFDESAPGRAASNDSEFRLYTDEERARGEPSTEGRSFVMFFQGSLRGLSVGAPVELRGINIGEVKSLTVEYDRVAGMLRFPVEVAVYPQRLRGHSGATAGANPASDADDRRLIDSLVAHGMRAELKSGSLLTGAKYVSVDVHKGAPREPIDWNSTPPIFPTAPGALDEIQDSIGSIAKKLDKVPYEEISRRLITSMTHLDALLKRTDSVMQRVDEHLAPQVQATLEQAQAALKDAQAALEPGAQNNLGAALVELTRAARSVSALADYLERHPEALIRGKPPDPTP